MLKKIRIEEKKKESCFSKIGSLFLPLFVSVLISATLINYAGADIKLAAISLFSGAFGGKRELIETLIKSTPLIFTGLATVIVFRAKIWNIGQEGQLFAGAIMGYWVYLILGGQNLWINIFLVIIAGFFGGALCGFVPAILKVYFKVDEVLSTVIINYIMALFLSFMLSALGPWRDTSSFYQQTPMIDANARLPAIFEGYRLHIGFSIAIVAAIIIHFVVNKTSFGYEIRAYGSNPSAAEAQGISVAKLLILTMIISGGLSGLAGISETFGILFRLSSRISPGYGFTGIIIAMVAGLNPLGVIPTAILFGGLLNGSVRLQVITGVPNALIDVILATVLLFVLMARVITSYRVRRIDNVE